MRPWRASLRYIAVITFLTVIFLPFTAQGWIYCLSRDDNGVIHSILVPQDDNKGQLESKVSPHLDADFLDTDRGEDLS